MLYAGSLNDSKVWVRPCIYNDEVCSGAWLADALLYFKLDKPPRVLTFGVGGYDRAECALNFHNLMMELGFEIAQE